MVTASTAGPAAFSMGATAVSGNMVIGSALAFGVASLGLGILAVGASSYLAYSKVYKPIKDITNNVKEIQEELKK